MIETNFSALSLVILMVLQIACQSDKSTSFQIIPNMTFLSPCSISSYMIQNATVIDKALCTAYCSSISCQMIIIENLVSSAKYQCQFYSISAYSSPSYTLTNSTNTTIYLDTSHSMINSYLTNYWPLNNNFNDIVSGQTLTAFGTSNFVTSPMGGPQSAIYIENGYMTAPSGVYFTGSDFTYAFWFKYVNATYTSSPWIDVFMFSTNTNTDYVYIQFSSTFQVVTAIWVGTSPGTLFESSSSVPNYSNWNHYAITFQASGFNSSVYLNGQLMGSINVTHAPASVTRQWCYIGSTSVSGQNTAITGYYDDIRIYNAALSQAQVFYLANNNFY